MATTRNIVLTLTLDCGRTPQNLGRTCNPSNTRSFLFRHCTGCFCDITARWQSPNTLHPTQSRSVFNLRFITHECVRAECAERGKKKGTRQTQTNSWLDGFTATALPFLANSLCLLSLSMGYVIVHFHRECVLARTLISEQLSFHTKEVLEINWHWSLQKRVAQ